MHTILPVFGFLAALIACAVFYSIRQSARAMRFARAASAQAQKSGATSVLRAGKYPRLTLEIVTAGRGQFEISREGAADRLVEGLGFSRTIRTADPAFGDRYHVDSDDEPFVTAFFSDASKRAAVETIFAAGFTSLSWDEGSVSADWSGFRPKNDNADFVGAAAAALRSLTLNVPSPAPSPVSAGGWSEKEFNSFAMKALLLGFFVFLGTIMFRNGLYGRPVDGRPLFLVSLLVSVPLALLFVLGSLTALRGKSWFLKAAGSLVLAAVLLFPALGYDSCQLLNSMLDVGAPASYALPVVDKQRSGGKSKNYFVCVAPWHPGQGRSCFEVGAAAYGRVQKGRTQARLTTRPGRLGHEWIVSLDFVDS